MARKSKIITLTFPGPEYAPDIKYRDKFKVKEMSNKYICIARTIPHFQNYGGYQIEFDVWEKPSRGYAKHLRRMKQCL